MKSLAQLQQRIVKLPLEVDWIYALALFWIPSCNEMVRRIRWPEPIFQLVTSLSLGRSMHLETSFSRRGSTRSISPNGGDLRDFRILSATWRFDRAERFVSICAGLTARSISW